MLGFTTINITYDFTKISFLSWLPGGSARRLACFGDYEERIETLISRFVAQKVGVNLVCGDRVDDT